MSLTFVNWDFRPAVLLEFGAFAVLSKDAPWKAVDPFDVSETGAVMSEEVWRDKFEEEYGVLDLSALPKTAPQSTAFPATAE